MLPLALGYIEEICSEIADDRLLRALLYLAHKHPSHINLLLFDPVGPLMVHSVLAPRNVTLCGGGMCHLPSHYATWLHQAKYMHTS